MIPIRSILVPVDFSAPSRAAMGAARELAEHFGASIQLLHVYGLSGSVFPPGFVLDPDVEARMATVAEHALRDLCRQCLSSNVHVTSNVVPGDAATEIVKRAAGADLVVMGTHGRTGLSHVLLGSVAERVIQTSPCPVLTVRGLS